jgi:CelD/BcsL family acetyltransferase involved in cellulose biosynthesis
MWLGNQPIAALVAFLDKRQSRFSPYLCGFDPAFAKFSPGNVLFAHSIRYSIQEGFREYDFLRGGESYKYMFGAINRFNKNFAIMPHGVLRVIERCDRLITRGITLVKQAVPTGASRDN